MEGIFAVQNGIYALVHWALIAVTLFAFITSLTFSAEAYRAAGKWSKPGWTILLAVAVLLQFFVIGGLLVQMALVIAALVFLADVRPALNSLRRR